MSCELHPSAPVIGDTCGACTIYPADFLTVPLANGGTWTRLSRLTDGRVMCCLCFGYFPREELNPVGPGEVEDVCRDCARRERS